MDKPHGFNLMKRYFLFFLLILSCNENEIIYWENYDETDEIVEKTQKLMDEIKKINPSGFIFLFQGIQQPP